MPSTTTSPRRFTVAHDVLWFFVGVGTSVATRRACAASVGRAQHTPYRAPPPLPATLQRYALCARALPAFAPRTHIVAAFLDFFTFFCVTKNKDRKRKKSRKTHWVVVRHGLGGLWTVVVVCGGGTWPGNVTYVYHGLCCLLHVGRKKSVSLSLFLPLGIPFSPHNFIAMCVLEQCGTCLIITCHHICIYIYLISICWHGGASSCFLSHSLYALSLPSLSLFKKKKKEHLISMASSCLLSLLCLLSFSICKTQPVP